MNEVLAFFLTWTTYGTRLHGDERGSVDRTHNMFGTPYLPECEPRNLAAMRLLSHPPYELTPQARRHVAEIIRLHSIHKDWPILSLNVRTNHVHVVVVAARVHPDQVMAQFKSWGTRRLRAEHLLKQQQPAWTVHGSTKWLWTDDDIASARTYVDHLQ